MVQLVLEQVEEEEQELQVLMHQLEQVELVDQDQTYHHYLQHQYQIQEFMQVEDQAEDFVLLLQQEHQVVAEQVEEMEVQQVQQELQI